MSRVAFEQLDVQAGDWVIEIGFGGGVLSRMLLDCGVNLTGIDRSDIMVRRARRRFAAEVGSGKATFHLGSAEALGEVGTFDKAVSVNTVYFWPDLHPVLEGFVRTVRSGGDLVLCFQRPDAVRRWPGHQYGFTAHERFAVEEAMVAAGLTITSTVEGSADAVGAFVSIKGEKL